MLSSTWVAAAIEVLKLSMQLILASGEAVVQHH